MESRDTVRKIREDKDGKAIVSFRSHDGYFKVPQDGNSESIKMQLVESQQHAREIHFIYDSKLNILEVK